MKRSQLLSRRKLSNALNEKKGGKKLNDEISIPSFRLQEQEGSVRRHFPKASKVIMKMLKRHNLNI